MLAGAAARWPLAAAPRPKLMIWLIAEQFRPDYLDELWPSLSPGGFRRLIEGGSYFPNCQFDAAAFTDSGLATLLTGSWPSMHGIVADRWLGPAAPEPVSANARALEAGTLFDSVLTNASNRVFLIASGAGAAFLGGTSSTRAFVSGEDEWKLAGGEGPAWFRSFRESNAPSKWRGASWLPVSSLSPAGSTPLRVLDAKDFPALYNASPFALANQFALAREAILQERLGTSDGLDVVTILAGSLGALGLETGASSPLMRDMVLHIDEQIASLLDVLDGRVGRANYAFIFTAAHGLDAKMPQRRGVESQSIATAVQSRMAAVLDSSQSRRNYVEAYIYPFLYLNRKSLQAINLDAPEARRMAARAAMNTGRIAGYYTADGESSYAAAWRERFANSCFAARSGDVMFSYPPHEAEVAEVVAAGSVYNYDTRVPLVFYGPMFRARTVEETVAAIDVAPTICRAFGLGLPTSATGQVLGEVIVAPVRAGR
jgi:Type I phosphodiesterase / nucleotide pyrophosphatase